MFPSEGNQSQQVIQPNSNKAIETNTNRAAFRVSNKAFEEAAPSIPMFTVFSVFVKAIAAVCTYMEATTLLTDLWVARPTNLVRQRNGSIHPIPSHPKNYNKDGTPQVAKPKIDNFATPFAISESSSSSSTPESSSSPSSNFTTPNAKKDLSPIKEQETKDQDQSDQVKALEKRISSMLKMMDEMKAGMDVAQSGSLSSSTRSYGLGETASTDILDAYVNQHLIKDCLFYNRDTGELEPPEQRKTRSVLFSMIKAKTPLHTYLYSKIFEGDVRGILTALSQLTVANAMDNIQTILEKMWSYKKKPGQSYPDYLRNLQLFWSDLDAMSHDMTEKDKVVRLLSGMKGDIRYAKLCKKLLKSDGITLATCNSRLSQEAADIGDLLSIPKPISAQA